MRRRKHLLILVLLAASLVVLGALRLQNNWRVLAANPTRTELQLSPTGFPSDAIPPRHMERYQQLALRWMQEYLRIDTSDPPGNEQRAAEWFQRIFDEEGIENRLLPYAPGRANLWARIPASRLVNGRRVQGARRRPIILLNHMDVVQANPAEWRVPPFSGAIVDGSLWGRGAQDMKNEGLAQLLVMVLLQREQPPLERDVIFLATADEEVKDTGTDWLIAHRRDLLGNAEYLLTEGGETLIEDGHVRYVGIDVAEKAPFWLHLTAHGRAGHGSRPIEESAPNRLVRALSNILSYQPELKVSPLVEDLLREMAPYQPSLRAAQFLDIRRALRDQNFRAEVKEDDSLNYLLRDTVQITMLNGAPQTNVIPNEAWANLDVRLLPGEDPKQFLETMRRVVDDPHVDVEPLDGFSVGNSSPMNTELYDSIRRVSDHYYPGIPVLPRLASGYNESQRYRPLGIVSYGYSPYASTIDEGSTEHAPNERIRVEEVRQGFRVLYDVVLGVAGAR